jgi:hypothetical protein
MPGGRFRPQAPAIARQASFPITLVDAVVTETGFHPRRVPKDRALLKFTP